MKAGVTPVLTSAWWKANKSTLVPADPLEKALKKYEVAKNTFDQARGSSNGDGYATYLAVKQVLGTDVLKAVESTIGSCNKLLHKDDIAGLNKYKSDIIPAAKTQLDKAFNEYKAKHEAAFNGVVTKMNQFLQGWAPIAALSAKTVLECEAAAPEADKALA